MRLLNPSFSKPEPDEQPDAPQPETSAEQLSQTPAGPRFKTHMKLSGERRDWYADRLRHRIGELRDEMGLDDEGNVVEDKFMAIRNRHQLTYDNDLEWRKKAHGGVFPESNLTLGTNKRYVREMGAKVSDDLLGTTPFFAAVKAKTPDQSAPEQPLEGTISPRDLSAVVEEFVQAKVELSNVQSCLADAQQVALIRNEAVVKTRYAIEVTPYVGPATVLADKKGNPLKTSHGLLIYEDDDFLPDPAVEELFRLRKDPTFKMRPGEYRFKKFPALEQQLEAYQGVQLGILDHRSFLCPLRVPCIHKADINVHLYDETPERLDATYGGFEVYEDYRTSRRMLPTTGEQQARESQGEAAYEPTSAIIQTIQIAECYDRLAIHADEGDPREYDVLAVLDMSCGRLLFYDYLANHMGKRPFEVIVGVEGVPNRWYGVGVMHMMEPNGLFIDTQLNRANVKESRTASITFRNPQAVKEWKAGLPTVFGSEDVYDVEPGFDKEKNPPIWRSNLMEDTEINFELMQKMEQAGNLQFGVISAKDASASNLNNSRTATGILNLERTSNVLTKWTENQQAKGIRAILQQVVETVLENMDETELMFSRDGQQLLALNKSEIRAIERDVKLLLTRARSTELLATNQQALMIAKDYRALMMQDPDAAQLFRPLYIQHLKALEVPDAHKLLPEVTPEFKQMVQEQQRLAAEAARETPKTLLNYKDAPESVKRQIESAEGFEPAPPEEIASDHRREKETEKAKAAAQQKKPAK